MKLAVVFAALAGQLAVAAPIADSKDATISRNDNDKNIKKG